MTKSRDPIFERSEAAFIERTQAMSVSGREIDQTAARAYRDLLPAFLNWLNDELRRGTQDEIVLSVLPSVLASQVATAVLNKYPDGKAAATMMDAIKIEFDKEWRRARSQVRAQTKA